MSKKIAVFINSLNIGGTEYVVTNFVNELVHKNYLVDLILINAVGPYKKKISKKVNIVDLKKKRLIFCFFKLIKYFKNCNPDIFLSHLTHINIFIIIIKTIIKTNCKFFLNETTTVSLKKKNMNFIKHALLNFLVPIFYPKANAIIAPSQGVKKDLIKNYKIKKDKIKIISNPINIKTINEDSKKKFCFNYNKKLPIIVAVGRLIKDKDYITMIKAVEMASKIRKFQLLILGDGPEKKFLLNYISINKLNSVVKLLGNVANPFYIIKKSKLFLLTSIREGMPTALLQALALNKQVISTDCYSGPKEVLKTLNCGKLARVGDYKQISKHIIDALNYKIKLSNSQKLKKLYDITNIVKKYENIFLS